MKHPFSIPSDPLDAEGLLRLAYDRFGARATLACSFGGAGGMVLLDLAARVFPKLDVFVLDTDFLFPETYQSLAEAEARYGIQVRRVRPLLSPDEQASLHGTELWRRDPDACCGIRKIEPMRRAVAGYDAWITAIRRDQSPTRQAVEPLTWDNQFGLWKLAPLAHWDEFRVQNYVFNHDLPLNPLLSRGYSSLGCTHCTKPASASRQGRWQGLGKTECGLHVDRSAAAVPATLTISAR
jgi:phosphoadenosine phosphosulfate reductase